MSRSRRGEVRGEVRGQARGEVRGEVRGQLVLVGTPIGNLGDLTPRAVEALGAASAIYCEDTRRTRALLAHAGVTGCRLVSLGAYKEALRVEEVLGRLRAGERVAVVSDAGMPGICDPGARLVAAAVEAGLDVDAVPGPNAALTALVLSGFDASRFCFEGFLPRSGAERRRRIASIASEVRTVLLHEAPGRLAGTLSDLAEACGADRHAVVARELTKLFQELWRGTLAEGAAWARDREVRGEVVVVLAGSGSAGPAGRSRAPGGVHAGSDDEEVRRALAILLAAGAGVRTAASQVAGDLGVTRRRAYETALAMKREAGQTAVASNAMRSDVIDAWGIAGSPGSSPGSGPK